jgi:hypothetical protein
MLLNKEQSQEWNSTAMDYLKEKEYEWITCSITDENEVYLFKDLLPYEVNTEMEVMELNGSELMELNNQCQFVICDRKHWLKGE